MLRFKAILFYTRLNNYWVLLISVSSHVIISLFKLQKLVFNLFTPVLQGYETYGEKKKTVVEFVLTLAYHLPLVVFGKHDHLGCIYGRAGFRQLFSSSKRRAEKSASWVLVRITTYQFFFFFLGSETEIISQDLQLD